MDTLNAINLSSYMIDNSNKVTICLNMIVKNESRIITRLLSSVLPIIDTYLICDTGSTDNTPQIITDFFNEHGILGEIVFEPFRNFGYNRTFALQKARGKATYALLLDADMIFKIEPGFDKQSLTAGQYLVLQKGGSLSYHNTRLVRLDIEVKCLCPTHEYYDFPHGTTQGRCDSLWIDDIGDGGCKSDKFERDIRLLKAGIEEEPNNARYYFYLANSYFNSGRHAESIPYYKKRIELGGWHEEVFYSHLNLGHAYITTKQDSQAITTWLEGYNIHPKRAETIYEITKYYRINGKNKIGMEFYLLGRKISYPHDDNLFIHNDVYNTGFDYELSILGYYNNYPDLFKIAHSLLNKPFNNRENVISNYKFYYPKLSKYLQIKIGGLPVKEKQIICGIEYDMMGSTPSIFHIKENNENIYYVNLRMVNYSINQINGSYIMSSSDGKIVSSNKLIKIGSTLDKSFSFSKSSNNSNRDIVMLYPMDNSMRYVGIEDFKPYSYSNFNSNTITNYDTNYNTNNDTNYDTNNDSSNNKIYFTGTIQSPTTGNICIGYGNFDIMSIFNSPSNFLIYDEVTTEWNKNCEKNWVFYGDYNVVYSWYPLITGKIINSNQSEILTGQTQHNKCNYIFIKQNEINMPEFFRDVRGSTHGYEFQDEIWFLCHIVEYCQPREYYHFFVVMDKNTMKPKKWSYLFKLESEKIEYVLGLIINNENIIISYSKWDSNPTISIFDKFKIEMEMFNI